MKGLVLTAVAVLCHTSYGSELLGAHGIFQSWNCSALLMMAKTWNIKALLHFLCTNTTCFFLVWNEHKAILPLKKLFSSFAMLHFPCMFLPFGRVPCQRNKSFNWQLIWALHQSWRAVICKTLPQGISYFQVFTSRRNVKSMTFTLT